MNRNATLLLYALAYVVLIVALVAVSSKANAYTCELVREHRATIETMDSRTKRTWIKRLKISKSQIRKARECLRG